MFTLFCFITDIINYAFLSIDSRNLSRELKSDKAAIYDSIYANKTIIMKVKSRQDPLSYFIENCLGTKLRQNTMSAFGTNKQS